MKIVILISAVVFNLSLVAQKDYHTESTANKVVAVEEIEKPVADVLLDTVEITAYASVAEVVKETETPVADVLLDTVEITAYSTIALAGDLR